MCKCMLYVLLLPLVLHTGQSTGTPFIGASTRATLASASLYSVEIMSLDEVSAPGSNPGAQAQVQGPLHGRGTNSNSTSKHPDLLHEEHKEENLEQQHKNQHQMNHTAAHSTSVGTATTPSSRSTFPQGKRLAFHLVAEPSRLPHVERVRQLERVIVLNYPEAGLVTQSDYSPDNRRGLHTVVSWLARSLLDSPSDTEWFIFLEPGSELILRQEGGGAFSDGGETGQTNNKRGASGSGDKKGNNKKSVSSELKLIVAELEKESVARVGIIEGASLHVQQQGHDQKQSSASTTSRLAFLANELTSDAGELLIIHHYNQAAIDYPVDYNFALSRPLAEALVANERRLRDKIDFVIDPLYEMMQMISKLGDDVAFMRKHAWPIQVREWGTKEIAGNEQDIAARILGDNASATPGVVTSPKLNPHSRGSTSLPSTSSLFRGSTFRFDLSEKTIVIAVKTTAANLRKRVASVWRRAFSLPEAWVRGPQKLEIVYMLDQETALSDAKLAFLQTFEDHTSSGILSFHPKPAKAASETSGDGATTRTKMSRSSHEKQVRTVLPKLIVEEEDVDEENAEINVPPRNPNPAKFNTKTKRFFFEVVSTVLAADNSSSENALLESLPSDLIRHVELYRSELEKSRKDDENNEEIENHLELGDEEEHLDYLFSDSVRESFVILPIKNTKRGHCEKMTSILKHLAVTSDSDPAEVELPAQNGSTAASAFFTIFDFAFVADDDTLLNVPALFDAFKEFDSNQDLYLGERYGYGIQTILPKRKGKDASAQDERLRVSGYDYITTGGGLGLTRSTVSKFRDGYGRDFRCRDPDTPDDMALGQWFSHHLRIPATHHPGFRQRRPQDYPSAYLFAGGEPISFHNVFSRTHDPLRSIWYPYLVREAWKQRLRDEQEVEVNEEQQMLEANKGTTIDDEQHESSIKTHNERKEVPFLLEIFHSIEGSSTSRFNQQQRTRKSRDTADL
ncbi:unnamed protein product [Amoebophrya sp. A25]|nr:unnamed protein product [Amoebophrya sp. A25]|eukprot:GSA25T00013815001.1